MIWTKNLPTEEGYYWCYDNGKIELVSVDFHSGDYLGEVRVWSNGYEVESLLKDIVGAYWLGPLIVPEPPIKADKL